MQITTSDHSLWEFFKKGDRETFAFIYNQYADELLRYGYHITSNRQLIKDSIQDLFLNLWNNKEKLSETDSIRFYLFRSLRNRILRNIENHKETVLPDMAFYTRLAEESIEDTLIETERESQNVLALKKAMEQLSRRQQEIIQLRYYHNFNNEEIARMMQLSNQSVRNLLSRSLAQLRVHFELAGWLSLILFVCWL